MKLLLVITVLVSSLWSSHSFAQSKRFLGFDRGQQGIGLLLGKPIGFRYQYWLNWRRSWFVDLGYDFDGFLISQASYAFYFYDARDQWKKKNASNAFLFYLAPGAFAGFRVSGNDKSNTVILGARGMGGLEYILSNGKFGLRIELGPVLYGIGRTLLGYNAMVGATYYWGTTKKKSSVKDPGLEFEGEDFKRKKDLEDEFDDSEFE